MPKTTGTRSTFGKLTTTQKTVDLPATGGTPAAIDCSGDMIVQVAAYVANEFFWCFAADATAAATAIAADATRCRWPSGFYTFSVSATENLLYMESTAGAATTDGLSYTLTEVD